MELRRLKKTETMQIIEHRQAIVGRIATERALSDAQLRSLNLAASLPMTKKERLDYLGVKPSSSANGYGPEFRNPGPI